MSSYIQIIKALASDRRGVTAMEYAVVAGAILGVALAAFKLLGSSLTSTMGAISL
jgi:Flp pilus assembly pilin Flp